MTPIISFQGVDYYEAQVHTEQQMDIANRLYRNWFLCQKRENTRNILKGFLQNETDGVPQMWLLFSFENPMMYPNSCKRGKAYRAPITVQAYHALLMILAEEQKSPKGVICSKINLESLCRDPWADASVCAAWGCHRLQSLSDELGGALELRFPAPEQDLELQMALKAQGYLADPRIYESDFGNGCGYLDFSRNLASSTAESNHPKVQDCGDEENLF